MWRPSCHHDKLLYSQLHSSAADMPNAAFTTMDACVKLQADRHAHMRIQGRVQMSPDEWGTWVYMGEST